MIPFDWRARAPWVLPPGRPRGAPCPRLPDRRKGGFPPGRPPIFDGRRGGGYTRPMLRLTEIKLPLDHSEDDLVSAVLRRLELDPGDLTALSVFRRGYDARRR